MGIRIESGEIIKRPWNPLDQKPFNDIVIQMKLNLGDVFKNPETGPNLLLWELANLGNVEKGKEPSVNVDAEVIKVCVGNLCTKKSVLKLLGEPKTSVSSPLLMDVAEEVNSNPFAFYYLDSLKRSGFFSKGFKLIDGMQESFVAKYEVTKERLSKARHYGLNDMTPKLSTEDGLGAIVPGKSRTRKWFVRTRALRDRENQDR